MAGIPTDFPQFLFELDPPTNYELPDDVTPLMHYCIGKMENDPKTEKRDGMIKDLRQKINERENQELGSIPINLGAGGSDDICVQNTSDDEDEAQPTV